MVLVMGWSGSHMLHPSKVYWKTCFTQIINFNYAYVSSFLIFVFYMYTLYVHIR